jgi:hypothetical protein
MQLKLIGTLVAGGMLATGLTACNDSDKAAAKACVAIFANDNYVDYSVDRITNSSPEGSEAYNMEQALKAQGYTVRTFTGITAADFTAATANCGTLIIPEQESGSLAPDIGAPEHTAISDFVMAGGNLVVGYADSDTTDLVNDIFGWSTTSIGVSTPINLVDNDAAGTPFAGGTTAGGSTLTDPSATDAFTAADLPAGSRIIYADNNGEAVVSLTQVGAGSVTLLGWDYYDAAPTGSVDDGWLEVLEQAVDVDALEMKIPLTNVALTDLQAKGWSTCFTATYDDDTTLLTDALSTCSGTELMLACRVTGDPMLTLAAGSPIAETMVDTNAADDGVTNDYEGISWYFNDTWSWGFASRGDSVQKNECDTDSSGKNDQRLCWHLGLNTQGVFDGGYRCGVTENLNSSTAYERVLLTR